MLVLPFAVVCFLLFSPGGCQVVSVSGSPNSGGFDLDSEIVSRPFFFTTLEDVPTSVRVSWSTGIIDDGFATGLSSDPLPSQSSLPYVLCGSGCVPYYRSVGSSGNNSVLATNDAQYPFCLISAGVDVNAFLDGTPLASGSGLFYLSGPLQGSSAIYSVTSDITSRLTLNGGGTQIPFAGGLSPTGTYNVYTYNHWANSTGGISASPSLTCVDWDGSSYPNYATGLLEIWDGNNYIGVSVHSGSYKPVSSLQPRVHTGYWTAPAGGMSSRGLYHQTLITEPTGAVWYVRITRSAQLYVSTKVQGLQVFGPRVEASAALGAFAPTPAVANGSTQPRYCAPSPVYSAQCHNATVYSYTYPTAAPCAGVNWTSVMNTTACERIGGGVTFKRASVPAGRPYGEWRPATPASGSALGDLGTPIRPSPRMLRLDIPLSARIAVDFLSHLRGDARFRVDVDGRTLFWASSDPNVLIYDVPAGSNFIVTSAQAVAYSMYLKYPDGSVRSFSSMSTVEWITYDSKNLSALGVATVFLAAVGLLASIPLLWRILFMCCTSAGALYSCAWWSCSFVLFKISFVLWFLLYLAVWLSPLWVGLAYMKWGPWHDAWISILFAATGVCFAFLTFLVLWSSRADTDGYAKRAWPFVSECSRGPAMCDKSRKWWRDVSVFGLPYRAYWTYICKYKHVPEPVRTSARGSSRATTSLVLFMLFTIWAPTVDALRTSQQITTLQPSVECSAMSPFVQETSSLINSTGSLLTAELPSDAGCSYATVMSGGNAAGTLIFDYDDAQYLVPLENSYHTPVFGKSTFIFNIAQCPQTSTLMWPRFDYSQFYEVQRVKVTGMPVPVAGSPFTPDGLTWWERSVGFAGAGCDFISSARIEEVCGTQLAINSFTIRRSTCDGEPFSGEAACVVSCDPASVGYDYVARVSKSKIVGTQPANVWLRLLDNTVSLISSAVSTAGTWDWPSDHTVLIERPDRSLQFAPGDLFAQRGQALTTSQYGGMQVQGRGNYAPLLQRAGLSGPMELISAEFWEAQSWSDSTAALAESCKCSTEISSSTSNAHVQTLQSVSDYYGKIAIANLGARPIDTVASLPWSVTLHRNWTGNLSHAILTGTEAVTSLGNDLLYHPLNLPYTTFPSVASSQTHWGYSTPFGACDSNTGVASVASTLHRQCNAGENVGFWSKTYPDWTAPTVAGQPMPNKTVWDALASSSADCSVHSVLIGVGKGMSMQSTDCDGKQQFHNSILYTNIYAMHPPTASPSTMTTKQLTIPTDYSYAMVRGADARSTLQVLVPHSVRTVRGVCKFTNVQAFAYAAGGSQAISVSWTALSASGLFLVSPTRSATNASTAKCDSGTIMLQDQGGVSYYYLDAGAWKSLLTVAQPVANATIDHMNVAPVITATEPDNKFVTTLTSDSTSLSGVSVSGWFKNFFGSGWGVLSHANVFGTILSFLWSLLAFAAVSGVVFLIFYCAYTSRRASASKTTVNVVVDDVNKNTQSIRRPVLSTQSYQRVPQASLTPDIVVPPLRLDAPPPQSTARMGGRVKRYPTA